MPAGVLRLTEEELAAIKSRPGYAEAVDPLQPRPGPGRRPRAEEVAERQAMAREAAARLAPRPLVDPALARLIGDLRRPLHLVGEDAVQAAIVWQIRLGTLRGDWTILVQMNRNDIRQRLDSAGRREGARAKAMGLQPGWPDLSVHWPGGSGLLECKDGTAGPTPEQRDVHALLRRWGQRVAVVRNWDQARDTLRGWGAIV